MSKPLIAVALLALVAALLTGLLYWGGGPVPSVDAAARPATPEPRGGQPARASGPGDQVVAPESVTPQRDPVDLARESEGGVWMGIGDAYTFGGQVVPRRELGGSGFDIYLQDMRHEVSLECPHGAVSAVRPLSSVGLPDSAASAAAILPDAPLHLPERNLTLTERPTLELPGIGFAMAADGVVYRLHVEQLQGHPDALQRRALVRLERVPQAEQGGMLRLPVVEGTLAPSADTPYLLNRAVTLGNALPGSNFTSYITGHDHVTVERFDSDLTINDHLILKEPLQSDVRVNVGSLFVEKDIEPGASVELLSNAGLAVGGDVHGNVKNSSYGFMYVRGSLTGEITHDSYATAIIEGDVTGTLRIRSYSDVLIRGRLVGTLDVEGSCWSTVYLQSFMSRQQLVDMEGNFDQITLHLAGSDLLPGQHEEIGTWRTVIVGDPVWEKLGR